MRWMTAFLLVMVSLAGCSDDASTSDAGDGDFDDSLDDSLQATEDTGIIRGVVVNTAIETLEGVTITIKQTGEETVTNENGAFGFADLEPGSYILVASKLGYNTTQSSTQVTAGVDDPPIVQIQLTPNKSTAPFVQPLYLQGHLTCGVAIVATSVGCTTFPQVADQINDKSVFAVEYDDVPMWVQGELVWESTQSLSGAFIWEIVQHNYPGSPQPHIGYRETTGSPALNYLNATVTEEYADWIVDEGLDFRFFGGPHEMCQVPGTFGCGLTVDQSTEAFVHNFYNFVPDEGWRFTADGDHPLP